MFVTPTEMYPVSVAKFDMGPIALQTFENQRISGRRAMSCHLGVVSHMVNGVV